MRHDAFQAPGFVHYPFKKAHNGAIIQRTGVILPHAGKNSLFPCRIKHRQIHLLFEMADLKSQTSSLIEYT